MILQVAKTDNSNNADTLHQLKNLKKTTQSAQVQFLYWS